MTGKIKNESGKVVNDLSELCSKKQQEEGVWFQLETDNGAKWDIDVLVFGNDSDKVQKYERLKMKERVKKLLATRNISAHFPLLLFHGEC